MGLYNMGIVTCGFCNNDIVEGRWIKGLKPCCKDSNFLTESYVRVCSRCGQIVDKKVCHNYDDYLEVRWKMRGRCNYKRIYWVCKRLDYYDGIYKSRVDDHNGILKAFKLISKLDNILLRNRRRFVAVDFVIGKLMGEYGLPNDHIKRYKCKETIESYEEFWKNVCELIGEDIRRINR